MNYLHGGAIARQATQLFKVSVSDPNYYTAHNGFGFEVKDVTWRLLWRDDRYEDGTIPEEEKDYLFVEPSPPGFEGKYTIRAEKYLERHNLPNPLLDGVRNFLSCNGGQPCPADGYWWTPASREGKGHFKKGDTMPDYPSSQYGATIWYRTKE
jgi:hypothetical protein